MNEHKMQHGFTLVELSIVLVILGLLIGGVLTGQTLIRSAELRSVSTQHSRYLTAIQTFRDKYFALPGDMTNAQSYWGVAHTTPATCVATASSDARTCNGDGNGQMDVSTGANERFRIWQHLANAGLIEGQYNGVAGSGGTNNSTVDNVPRGSLSSALWSAGYWTTRVANTDGVFDGPYDNFLLYGGSSPTYSSLNPVFKPEELYNIDMKMDDGKPAVGKVVIRTNGNTIGTTCTTGSAATDYTADYKLTTTALACAAIFRQQF